MLLPNGRRLNSSARSVRRGSIAYTTGDLPSRREQGKPPIGHHFRTPGQTRASILRWATHGGRHGDTSKDEQAACPAKDDLLPAEAQEAGEHHLDRIAGGVPSKHPQAEEDGARRDGEARAGPGPEPGQGHAEETEPVGQRTERATSHRAHPPARSHEEG